RLLRAPRSGAAGLQRPIGRPHCPAGRRRAEPAPQPEPVRRLPRWVQHGRGQLHRRPGHRWRRRKRWCGWRRRRGSSMTTKNRSPTARAREEETVAQEAPVGDEETAQNVPEAALAAMADPEPDPEPAPAPEKGFCDNHKDRPAIAVTNFPWLARQQ